MQYLVCYFTLHQLHGLLLALQLFDTDLPSFWEGKEDAVHMMFHGKRTKEQAGGCLYFDVVVLFIRMIPIN